MATLPGSNSSTVRSSTNAAMAAQGVPGTTTTVLLNGANGDVADGVQGDTVTVTVSVPYNSISWLPSGLSQFFGNKTLSSTQVMRRE
jgi:hypothetical protein